jgi:hypothetical protein
MKGQRKPRKVKVSNLLEQKLAGAEPIFNPNIVAEPSALADAYNWYNVNYEYQDSRRFLVSYLKEQKTDPRIVDSVNNLPITFHVTTVGWVARILSRGAKVNSSCRQWFDAKVKEIVNASPEKPVEAVFKVSTIQERMFAQFDAVVADIDEQIDLFFDGKIKTFDTKNYLAGKKLSAPVTKRVVDHYKPLQKEYAEAIERKDEQLVEGYRGISRQKIKAMKAFLDEIVAEFSSETYKAKMVRKPRRARVVPATKQVSKMKFMMHCAEPELHSVAPETIIGASQLWVYNVKKRKLGVYHSESATGLRVKGSTIQAFNPKTSLAKKLRKPEKVLAIVTQGGKVALRSVLDDVRAVASSLTGRISGDTILVRVVK